MMRSSFVFLFVVLSTTLGLVYGLCDNFIDEWIYDQIISSPLDKCIAKNASASYTYHCTDYNTTDDYYYWLIDDEDNWLEKQDYITVVRSDYPNADCQGAPSVISNITNSDWLYEISCGTQCDTLAFREYPVSSLSECVVDAHSNDWTSYPYILDQCIAYDLEYAITYNCATFDDGELLWWTDTFLDAECTDFNRIEREYHRNAFGCAQNHKLNEAKSKVSIQLMQCDVETEDTLFAHYTTATAGTNAADDEECGNYWIPALYDDVYAEYQGTELIPFDECISTHIGDDIASYKFTCDPSSNADEIYKESYGSPNCQGDAQRLLYTEKTPEYINCKPENACDVFKMTYYTAPMDMDSFGDSFGFDDQCDELYTNNLAEYAFSEVLISTSPCFDDGGKTSSLACDAIGTVSKQFNGNTCDQSNVETLRIAYRGNGTLCAPDILESTVRFTTYECLSSSSDIATTVSVSSPSTSSGKTPPSLDAHSKEESSSWTTKVIVVSVSIIVAFGLIILFGCWYNKMKEANGYANLELLRLVNDD